IPFSGPPAWPLRLPQEVDSKPGRHYLQDHRNCGVECFARLAAKCFSPSPLNPMGLEKAGQQRELIRNCSQQLHALFDGPGRTTMLSRRRTRSRLSAELLTALIIAWNAAATAKAAENPKQFHRPLLFEPNHGQVASEVKWLARGSGYQLFFASDGVTI